MASIGEDTRKYAIIRTGDIIKIGRVPIMIKESSVDFKKLKELMQF
jgi:hypothetical protein